MGLIHEAAYQAGDGRILVRWHANVESSRFNRLLNSEFIYTELVYCYNLMVEVDRGNPVPLIRLRYMARKIFCIVLC